MTLERNHPARTKRTYELLCPLCMHEVIFHRDSGCTRAGCRCGGKHEELMAFFSPRPKLLIGLPERKRRRMEGYGYVRKASKTIAGISSNPLRQAIQALQRSTKRIVSELSDFFHSIYIVTSTWFFDNEMLGKSTAFRQFLGFVGGFAWV